MVMLKLFIILLVIGVGIFYVDIDNWHPFMPNGFGGVMGGVAAVFFAYIGFDAVSTLAEESKNPQQDLPKGMIYSLVICTVIYIILSLVLTGMVSYAKLGVNDPLAEVFKIKAVKWMLFIVSIGAVVAMTSVILVFQLGQPRIWMSMSRDGLMPKKFSTIHPKYKTPSYATIITGLVVAVPIFFTDEKFILDFTSISTLFAFVLVCGGVLTLPHKTVKEKGKFHLPYVNGKYIIPAAVLLSFILLLQFNRAYLKEVFSLGGDNFTEHISMLCFFIICIIMSVATFVKNFSLIPVCGLLSCCYLLTGMSPANWTWFFGWLLLGLIIYFAYGYKKSRKIKALFLISPISKNKQG
jgi:amino acid transporter